jgi:hypothetical protein
VDHRSTYKLIDTITYNLARSELDSESKQLLFLQSWWSRTYNRPLKDPLLLEYTTDELYYEYRDRIERDEAIEERSEQEADKIEDNKVDESLKWAEEEERKERENAEKKASDQKWMDDQLTKYKEEFGEDFGNDIAGDFSDG